MTTKNLKLYKVTFHLIIGYENNEVENPITKEAEYEVSAYDKADAVLKAAQLDKTSYSIYESCVEEL